MSVISVNEDDTLLTSVWDPVSSNITCGVSVTFIVLSIFLPIPTPSITSFIDTNLVISPA